MSRAPRFTSPSALKALTAPLTLALFGAVAVVLVLAGLPLAVAIGGGLLAGAGRVAIAGAPSSATRRPTRIDPFAVGEPWRVFVREALQAQARFATLVNDVSDGPFRDRLDEIGRSVDLAVEDCWINSRRAHELSRVRRQIDTRALERRLAGLDDVANRAGTVEDLRSSLVAQLDSARRIDSAIENAHSRLEILDVRLAESVTRAAELASMGDQPGLTGLAADIEGVVDEMEALRRALDEVDQAEGPADP
ncbi:MAG: hypothetical protein GY929_12245 [Actinomycetia bacterium]|nr:hypothetical protein [Actinomycetes bacterium]